MNDQRKVIGAASETVCHPSRGVSTGGERAAGGPVRHRWVYLQWLAISLALALTSVLESPSAHAWQSNDSQESVAEANDVLTRDGGRDVNETTVALKQIPFWTTRRPVENQGDPLSYGNELGGVATGEVTVSIPKVHRPGGFERPLLGRATPARHLTLEDATSNTMQDWLTMVEAQLADAKRKEILILVHGFNMDFEEAAFRAAQWAYDSCYAGVLIMFSWPSQGEFDLDSYQIDQTNAMASVPGLVELMETLGDRFPDIRRHVLAHSLGSRMVMAAALHFRSRPEKPPRLMDKLVLAAPDIDDQVFRRMGATALQEIANDVTVLCNPRDRALQLSVEQHGDRLRAGLVAQSIDGINRVTCIDVSEVVSHSNLLGMNHMYFTDCPVVMKGINQLLEGNDWSEELFSAIQD